MAEKKISKIISNFQPKKKNWQDKKDNFYGNVNKTNIGQTGITLII